MLMFCLPARLVFCETLVILNKAENTASLVDLRSNKVESVLPTGQGPHEVAVSADGTYAVVCNYGTREIPGSSLTVIDVPGKSIQKTIDLNKYKRPHGIQWLSEHRVIVTVEQNRAVIVVDLESGRVEKEILTDQDLSHMVALSPDKKRAYVASIGSGTVTVLDLEKGTRIKSIPTGDGAEGIDLTPDGREVWVTNRAADSISVLSPKSLEIVSTIASKSFPIRVKITPDGRNALVSNARSGDIAVFDVGSKKELRRIVIPLEASEKEGRVFEGFGNSSVPVGILIPPDGKRAFVAHANADSITILDLVEWKPVGSIKAGKEPDGLGYSQK